MSESCTPNINPIRYDDDTTAASAGVLGDSKESQSQEEEEWADLGGEGDGLEEAKIAKPMRDPGQPTSAEREAHEATHLPYRSWCPVCVAGRRDNPSHRAVPVEEPSKPEVLLDY